MTGTENPDWPRGCGGASWKSGPGQAQSRDVENLNMLFPSNSNHGFSPSIPTHMVSRIFFFVCMGAMVTSSSLETDPTSLGPSTKFLQEIYLIGPVTVSRSRVTLHKHSCNVPSLWQFPGKRICCELDRCPQGSRTFLRLKPKRPLWSLWRPHPVGVCLCPGLEIWL